MLTACHGVKLAVVRCETTHSICKADNGRSVPLSSCMLSYSAVLLSCQMSRRQFTLF